MTTIKQPSSRLPIFLSLALVAIAAISGCGGGSGGTTGALTPSVISAVVGAPTPSGALIGRPDASTTPAAVVGQSTKTNVIIVIAPPADIIAQAISRVVAAARHAQFVSPGTDGVQLTISQGSTQIASTVADVSSGSSLCTSTNGARTCTVPLNVASGTYTFGLTSYNEAPSGGTIPGGAQQLGTATASATVLVGQTNQINFFIGAVVSSVGIGTQGTTTAYSSLPADGNNYNYSISVIPTDASGNPISGSSSSLANPVTATLVEGGGLGHAFLRYNGTNVGATATVTHASDSLSITYDGAGNAGYSMTITFTASGVPTSTLVVSPMFIAGDSKYSGGQVVFTATAQSEAFSITEQSAPGTVAYTSSGAVCPALPTGSNPLLTLPLTGNITGSGASASMTVTASIAPKTTTGCSATIADNLGTASTVPIMLPSGTATASSAAANVQIDPTHYSSGSPAPFSVTYNSSPVTSLSVPQGNPIAVAVSETNDVTAPVVTATTCTGIISFASSLSQGTWSSGGMGSLSGTVTFFGTTSGSCSATIADGNGQSVVIALTAVVPGTTTEYTQLSGINFGSCVEDANMNNGFITLGPDNRIWISGCPNGASNTLLAINTSTQVVSTYTPTQTTGPSVGIVTSGGTLYRIESSGSIDIMNTNGTVTSNQSISYNSCATGDQKAVVGKNGTIWILGPGGGGWAISGVNTTNFAANCGAGSGNSGQGGYVAEPSLFGFGPSYGAFAETWEQYDPSCDEGGSTWAWDDVAIGANTGTFPGNASCGGSAARVFQSPQNHFWFMESASQVYDATSNAAVPSVMSAVHAVTMDSSGNTWLGGLCGSTPCFVEYNTIGNPALFLASSLHSYPAMMFQGADGNIWFVESGGYFGKVIP